MNGSTSGIMTAIHATCHRGDVILAARNCHKAVYNAICMLELEPEYIVPDYVDMRWHCGVNQAMSDKMTDARGKADCETREGTDIRGEGDRETPERVAVNGGDDREVSERTDILGDISPDKLERAIITLITNGRKPSAVIITSPTYEGVISDIGTLAEITHRYGIYLIVDEAQGAQAFTRPCLHSLRHRFFMLWIRNLMRESGDICRYSRPRHLRIYLCRAWRRRWHLAQITEQDLSSMDGGLRYLLKNVTVLEIYGCSDPG